MRFEFATASRIIFGAVTAGDTVSLAGTIRNRAFVVTGATVKRAKPLLEQLEKNGIKYTTFNVSGEPTVYIVKTAIEKSRKFKSDFVISIGGGSVLDTGKVVAAMLTNSGELEDYLEVVGRGQALTCRAAFHIAVPTTAGTGAEVTRNAVIGVPDYKVKVSMRSPLMLPTISIIDPELTYSMPPSITASTGLDAMTQLIEAYTSNKANPLVDCLCREGLMRASRSIYEVYMDGNNKSAREDMALASLFSGLALANAGLGAVHGIAGPLGGMISVPHGVICARLLPYVMQFNIRALQKRSPDSLALHRYNEIARILTGRADAKASDGIAWVEQLYTKLEISSLTDVELTQEDFLALMKNSKKSSSMKGNPIVLTDDELSQILYKSFIVI